MEQKIAVLNQWVSAINNGSLKKKTESECEQAFNNDIFHKVLGYTFYPNDTYTLEAKGGNEISGQKADATLGYFDANDTEKNVSLVQVAVEIKDANTSLTKSQRREGNLSPIQQWFKYKPQYNNCKWVIVTNFVEIRFFKDTQLDYEVWQLADLVSPDNEYQNFKVFWYLLNAKHLIATPSTESLTEKLLSTIRIQSEQITKKFYHAYKSLRLELINDIRKHNSDVSLDIVIQKAQKVIDRIVFVHFCEDFWLLPEGKLAEVIQHSQSLIGVSIWQILSGFFEAVNSGSTKLGIPNGYNGGLFHEDKELNTLKIGDDICRKFVELWKYDFQEDLSVNILGHIFEQSISDLENLRIDMLGTQLETEEVGESTKSNKRKKDGIFYTPEYIVDYIVRNSLGKYLEEQFETIEKKHLKNEKKMSDKVYHEKQKLIYGEYKHVLENIKVLDPACGSGAFLVKVFDYLLDEHKRVGESLGIWSLFDNESTYKSILQNNIYGVDLNAESVEITKLSLWLKTAEKGKKLADLDNNIKCGNSLIDDPAVAGDKAFNWEMQFPSVFPSGMALPATIWGGEEWWFDVIVGNPPYVSTKSTQFLWDEKFYFQKNYEVAEYQTDTYPLFVEKATKVIKNKWIVAYIMPNSRLNNLRFWKLRKFLLDKNIYEITLLPSNVFEDATVDTVNIFVSKWRNSKNILITEYINTNFNEKHRVEVERLKNNKDYIFDIQTSQAWVELIKKIEKDTVLISDILETSRWVNPYDKYRWQSEEVIKNRIYHSDIKKDDSFIPELKGEWVWRYSIQRKGNTWISYWNWLAAPREPKYFNWNRILIRKIPGKKRLIASFIDSNFVADQSIYIWLPQNNLFDIKYILWVINSVLIWYYFKYKNWEFDDIFPQMKVEHFRNLPIKNISLLDQQPFIEKAGKMLSLNKDLHEKIDFILRFLQSKFGIEKPSTKMQKFRELDFAGFIKELKLKKLPMDQEAELMRYFEKEKTDIMALKWVIDATDKEIDKMVFDLYGLSEEERKVVLGG